MQATAHTPRRCPRCRTPLSIEVYEGVDIDECRSCRGAYLDADELSKILQARGVDVRAYQRRAKAGVPKEERSTDVDCPGCGGAMAPTNFNYSSGTILDRCGQCFGVWCDGQELERAQAHYEIHQDRLAEQKPALIALVTDVEHTLAADLRVFRRWKWRKTAVTLIFLVAASWAVWELVSPLAPHLGIRLTAILLPVYFIGLRISRCPVCAKHPVRSGWRRPWRIFSLSECEQCGVPLTR